MQSQTEVRFFESNNRSNIVANGASFNPGLREGAEPSVYSDIPDDTRQAIQSIQLNGPSYSTKLDTLIKHILWLRQKDPGAKSIIFIQFRTYWTYFKQAFMKYSISYASFTSPDYGYNLPYEIKRFKDDSALECLLMDAGINFGGLNLVNASHIFLCEPILNTTLELQVAALVDRIGQKRETTIWLYHIEGTVEDNIQALSDRRRLAHLGADRQNDKSKEITAEEVEAASMKEAQKARLDELMNQGGSGEVVQKDDLWECLFGRTVPVPVPGEYHTDTESEEDDASNQGESEDEDDDADDWW